ncbi:hypothetical protein L6452_38989 [Arctium lappa]|uniref:Uncharacterized protein n=1 Tax=Arctium lappa TaxID=4217 RepID=A0ACB8XS87_ARCLA|nr:hypothetical protein L6452_38989 [Arctium lappa]
MYFILCIEIKSKKQINERSERVSENNFTDSDESSCKPFMSDIFPDPKPSDFDQTPEQKQFSKEFNDFMFPNASKAPQFNDDDLFEDEFGFLNSDGCVDECVEKFDFNAKLPDHSAFVIKYELLPNMRLKKSEARLEWRPKKKIEETTKSFSDSECNRDTDSVSDVLGQCASHKTKLTHHMWYLDLGCSKHMTGHKYILSNYTEKFCGNVRFGNDQFSPILGYGDVVQENITIKNAVVADGGRRRQPPPTVVVVLGFGTDAKKKTRRRRTLPCDEDTTMTTRLRRPLSLSLSLNFAPAGKNRGGADDGVRRRR